MSHKQKQTITSLSMLGVLNHWNFKQN